jgi:hypothetical protein
MDALKPRTSTVWYRKSTRFLEVPYGIEIQNFVFEEFGQGLYEMECGNWFE